MEKVIKYYKQLTIYTTNLNNSIMVNNCMLKNFNNCIVRFDLVQLSTIGQF